MITELVLGGGVYFWRDREAAARWRGEDFSAMVTARYGSAPRIQVSNALVHVDAAAGRFEEF
ncbi:MAG: hypothetical protein AAFR16_10420 [Pseudomonadota bacterium]